MEVSFAWMRLLMASVALRAAGAMYLPGFTPVDYEEGATVELKVNKLTSSKTQLPFSYYTLPYCQPESIHESAGNLGETLMGDLIENSPYELRLLVNESCKLLCTRKLPEPLKNEFRNMIEEEYVVNWIVDNLPSTTRYRPPGGRGEDSVIYKNGFTVGTQIRGHYYLHNHVSINLQYHCDPEKYVGYRIVGFHVEPRSMVQRLKLDSEAADSKAVCQKDLQITPLDLDEHNEVTFTYDVLWTWSEVRWASRWDAYLKTGSESIHWFSILNSMLILLLLSAVVAMILVRTILRDITKYNELTTAEEAMEETGWKLVHGDVFRKPNYSTFLCVLVGSGVQILGMCIVTLVFSVLGLLSPARRGALLQFMMLLFTVMGIFAGYTSARLCKVFDGEGARWKWTTMLTAFVVPGIFFLVFFVLNLLIWGQKSTGAVPFMTLIAIVVLWFGVSVPLVLLGAHVGFRKVAIELPVKVHQIPRQVPELGWCSLLQVTAMGGALPFVVVFTELLFIMTSIWKHQFYYLFGFLALTLAILIVTCAEVSICFTYFQLASEDYRWWWKAYFCSASSGVYLFGYSIWYFHSLRIDQVVPTILYFGYMALNSIMLALLTGTVGLISTFYFVKTIYASIKVD